MKQLRFDNFSDAIFAIILTFLAFDLHIPSIVGLATNAQIIRELYVLAPTLLSFILSFALVYTYWQGHNYIASIYAKNVDRRLSSINGFFFFFICLIPFSAKLLGEYGYTQVGIWIYGANIILISLSLLWMRNHVFSSEGIDHARVTVSERRRGALRLMLPLFSAIAAIALAYVDTRYSFILFTLAILFNIVPGSTHLTDRVIGSVHEKVTHMKAKED